MLPKLQSLHLSSNSFRFCLFVFFSQVGVTVSGADATSAPFHDSDETSGCDCIRRLIQEGRAVQSGTLQGFVFIAVISFIKYWVIILLYNFHVDGLGQTQQIWLNVLLEYPLALLCASLRVISLFLHSSLNQC